MTSTTGVLAEGELVENPSSIPGGVTTGELSIVLKT